MIEGTHRFFQRRLRIGPVVVVDIHIVETHPLQTLVETGNQILARTKIAVGPRPHIPARLGRDDQLVAMGRQIVGQNLAETVFR